MVGFSKPVFGARTRRGSVIEGDGADGCGGRGGEGSDGRGEGAAGRGVRVTPVETTQPGNTFSNI